MIALRFSLPRQETVSAGAPWGQIHAKPWRGCWGGPAAHPLAPLPDLPHTHVQQTLLQACKERGERGEWGWLGASHSPLGLAGSRLNPPGSPLTGDDLALAQLHLERVPAQRGVDDPAIFQAALQGHRHGYRWGCSGGSALGLSPCGSQCCPTVTLVLIPLPTPPPTSAIPVLIPVPLLCQSRCHPGPIPGLSPCPS